MYCDGYSNFTLNPSSATIAVGNSQQFTAQATDSYGHPQTLSTGTWSTSDNGSISTVSSGNVTGVAPGGTSVMVNFQNIMVYQDNYCVPDSQQLICPTANTGASATVTITPRIDSISPNTVLVGSNNVQLTINGAGFGSSPTVNLPAGVTAPNGQGSTNSQILITVNVSINATISPNSISVTSGGQTSNNVPFTLDGPDHMIVLSDSVSQCSEGCQTTVQRLVEYQVINLSGVNAPVITIGETPVSSGWNCNQSFPGVNFSPCSNGYQTDTLGRFSDRWTLRSDVYTPVGCGDNIDDHWQWCPTNPPRSFGHLSGYVHTNAISINGVVSPPNPFASGTVINP